MQLRGDQEQLHADHPMPAIRSFRTPADRSKDDTVIKDSNKFEDQINGELFESSAFAVKRENRWSRFKSSGMVPEGRGRASGEGRARVPAAPLHQACTTPWLIFRIEPGILSRSLGLAKSGTGLCAPVAYATDPFAGNEAESGRRAEVWTGKAPAGQHKS